MDTRNFTKDEEDKILVSTRKGLKYVTPRQASVYRAQAQTMRLAWAIAREAAEKFGGKASDYMRSGTNAAGEHVAGAFEQARKSQAAKERVAWATFWGNVVRALEKDIDIVYVELKEVGHMRMNQRVKAPEKELTDTGRVAAGRYVEYSGNGNAKELQTVVYEIMYGESAGTKGPASETVSVARYHLWQNIIDMLNDMGFQAVAQGIENVRDFILGELRSNGAYENEE